MSDVLRSPQLRRRAIRSRADLARVALTQVQGGRDASALHLRATLPPARRGLSPKIIGQLARRHGWLIVLVLLVTFGDAGARWSAWLTAAGPEADAALGLQRVQPLSQPGDLAVARSSGDAEAARSVLQAAKADPLEPAPSVPQRLQDAFREPHLLAPGETLGALAQQYGVSLAALVWSNGLERGDALVVGLPLRIPRISGVPYTVMAGEDVALVAGRFGVAPEAIRTFEPNHLQDGRALAEGEEIFVPGADPALPEALLGQGGLEGLAARGPEPAGLVREDETNLREGPGTDYGRVVQLDRGRRVVLWARHGDWLKVAIADAVGWIRADLLQIEAGLVAALPETDDFPPPPPRWVWPTWGALTSRFGPRWGSFHNGIDIANRAWTPIVAARSGRVIESGWCSGYGYCVKISHGGGVQTIYGHLITQPNVAAGEDVVAGQRIGAMGSTYDRAGGGYSTGVHLHFTLQVNGRAVNPLTVLP